MFLDQLLNDRKTSPLFVVGKYFLSISKDCKGYVRGSFERSHVDEPVKPAHRLVIKYCFCLDN